MSVYLNFALHTIGPFVVAHPAVAIVPAAGFGLYKGAKYIKNNAKNIYENSANFIKGLLSKND